MTPQECCPYKVRFTRSAARRRARWLRSQGRGFRRMAAYHCDYCRAWHVGHQIGMHTDDASRTMAR